MSLWDEAIARPDDLEVRAVLADELQGANDPRGELMSLQLLPADPEEAGARRARIRELVALHHRTWLGSMCRFATGARFDRGFITRLAIASERELGGGYEPWREAWPILAQVRELIGPRYGGFYHQIVTGPHVPALQKLEIEIDDVPILDKVAPSVEHLACRLEPTRSDERRQIEERVLPLYAKRDRLTSMSIAIAGWEILADVPWLDRLTSLGLVGPIRSAFALWSKLPSTTELVATTRPGLDTCTRDFPGDHQVVLKRDGTARISGEWLLYPLDVLDALPPEIRCVELEDTSELIIERVRGVVGKRGIEVRVLGEDGRAGIISWPKA